jgi:hypothetical protein
MALALLSDLEKEVHRLSVAGSNLASQDFRLKNQIPQLEKAASSSAVFKRLHQMVLELIECNPDNATNKLLDLSALLHAIEYTRGKTGVDGEIQEIESEDLGIGTPLDSRRLNELINALTSKGSGRLNLIIENYPQNNLLDIRLVLPLIGALSDYSEIADFAKEKLICYGQAVLPLLLERFKMKGNAGDGRCLEVIFALAGSSQKKLYFQALDEGSLSVKKAALSVIAAGKFDEAKERIKEYVNSKNPELKKSAEEAMKKLKKGLFGLW